MSDIFELLSLLTPRDIDLPKRRIGGEGDGGYVAADMFRKNQSVFSYGIADEVSFDLELAEEGLKIWQFDHTIPGAPVVHPNITFSKEGVAGSDMPEERLFTITAHTERLGIPVDGAILKMDVEGAEWDVLGQISPNFLARFDQLFFEFHTLGRLGRPRFDRQFRTALEKLNAYFTLFHVHANNARPLVPVNGFVVPGLLEVSYIRSDLVQSRQSRTWYPTSLDAPNAPGRPDLRLWLHPFAPVP